MTATLRKLLRDDSGANAIELAIALPILTLMIYGIFSIGLLFQANAGLQHALGEASRLATIHPTPSDTDIQSMITNKKFGLNGGTLQAPVIDNSQISSGYKTITLTYTRPMNFLFFQGPTVTLTRSKRVYIAV